MTVVSLVNDDGPTTVTLVSDSGTAVQINAETSPVVRIGVPGPPGPQGAAGPVGGNFEHTQAAPSTVWVVAHGLGFRPNVQVFDALGVELLATIEHVDNNSLQISHGVAIAGVAYLS